MTGVASHASGADAGRSWWWVWRIAIAAATAVAVVAFTYRYNALEGTRGGLENDHVAHLMRTDMLLQGEQPLRDFAAAEPRGAWLSLSYAVPAWAQTLGGQRGRSLCCTGRPRRRPWAAWLPWRRRRWRVDRVHRRRARIGRWRCLFR